MDDVARILWLLLPLGGIVLGLIVVSAITAVQTARRAGIPWEAALHTTCEVGVLVATLYIVVDGLLSLGTIGRAWSWSPVLATLAALVLSWVGVLMLRASVRDPERRALWSALVTLVALFNLPLTLGALVHWRQLDTSGLVSRPVLALPDPTALVLHALVLIGITGALWWARWRLAVRRGLAALPEPLPETQVTAGWRGAPGGRR